MDNFGEALAAIRDLKNEGIVTDYAIGGAMAVIFWAEPTPTFDLDVFVLFKSSGIRTSLEPIYQWARARGYEEKSEHIIMAGVPVRFLPAYNLVGEAVEKAAEMDYDGIPVRVIRPEHLIAKPTEAMSNDWADDPLLSQLQAGKRELRESRRNMSLPEKVRQVVELQKIVLTTARRRRTLGELEVVWQLEDRP